MTLRFRKLLWVIAALLTGCAPPNRPGIIPMRALDERVTRGDACASERPERLIVMLPGLFDTPEDFVKHGFVTALRERGITARVVIPDAHFNYYESRTIEQRIFEDVVMPARASGVREIWFVGVSMGALGSMIFSGQHRDIVQRIFLIGPYPGTDKMMAALRAAGGPIPWAKLPAEGGPEYQMHDYWRWMATRSEKPEASPVIVYGTGENDRYGKNQRVLASLIPQSAQYNQPGGHDWPTWRSIWLRMLDALPAEVKGGNGPRC